MGRVSAQVEALFVPKKGHDKADPDGIWDLATSAALEDRIDCRLQVFFNEKPCPENFRQVRKLRRIYHTANSRALVADLAETAMKYTAKNLRVKDYTRGLAANAPRRGARPRPEVQILFHDVQKILSTTLKQDVGIWQIDKEQGIVVVIARMLAASVGKPLTQRPWRQIKKARKVQTL
jgi:hypothetical protein